MSLGGDFVVMKFYNADPELPAVERIAKTFVIFFSSALMILLLFLLGLFVSLPDGLWLFIIIIFDFAVLSSAIYFLLLNHPLPFAISWEEEQRRKKLK